MSQHGKATHLQVWKQPQSLEELECYDSYEEDRFQAGKSKRWTFFNMNAGELPIKVEKTEHYYILEGDCSVVHESLAADGATAELHPGDFAVIPVGQITFKVEKRVRMFFTDHQSSGG